MKRTTRRSNNLNGLTLQEVVNNAETMTKNTKKRLDNSKTDQGLGESIIIDETLTIDKHAAPENSINEVESPTLVHRNRFR